MLKFPFHRIISKFAASVCELSVVRESGGDGNNNEQCRQYKRIFIREPAPDQPGKEPVHFLPDHC
jgi:hypothetical protein